MLTDEAYRNQPLKTSFILYRLLSIVVRLPWTVCKSLVPSLRPRSSWSFVQCMIVYVLQELTRLRVRTSTPVKSPLHLELDPREGFKGVWVNAVPNNYIVGEVKEWAEIAHVEAVKLPAYWINKHDSNFDKDWKPSKTDKVLYSLHGGGYTYMSARSSDPTANIPKGILASCQEVKRSFAIEYRLSAGKPFQTSNPFPAALIDALSGYHYLVNVLGYSPSSIIVVGDSAGGNLALAFVRYLLNSSMPSLPLPAALLLLSPWVDTGMNVENIRKPGSSYVTRYHTDYIDPRLAVDNYTAKAFTGPFFKVASTNEYISPASSLLPSISFKGFPRTFILAGDAEVLLDQIRVLKDRMQNELGPDSVTYHEAKDGIHDFLMFPWFEPRRNQALQEVAAWVDSL